MNSPYCPSSCPCRRTVGSIGQHPDDTAGHLRRDEVWHRVVVGLLIGVSLGIAATRGEDDADVLND